MRLIIISLVLLASCGDYRLPDNIAPEYVEFVNNFKARALKEGVAINTQQLIVYTENDQTKYLDDKGEVIENAVGICELSKNTAIIKINKARLAQSNSDIEEVLWHESFHCIVGLKHTAQETEGYSLMVPRQTPYYNAYKELMISNAFNDMRIQQLNKKATKTDSKSILDNIER